MARKKEATLSAFTLVQQLDPDFYGWTVEEKTAIENKDIATIEGIIMQRLYNKGMAVEEMHCITHDKDVREVWDSTVNTYVVEQKPDHIHCLVKFVKIDGRLFGGTLLQIADALGVEPQYIEKPKTGRFSYDNCLAYLIHAKDGDKHQYDVSEVVSSGCCKDGKPLFRPYVDYYNERKKDWEAGRIKKKNDKARVDANILEEMILTGQVCRNQILLTNEYYAIYARNKRRCEDALDTYAQHKIAKTVRAMENGEFKLSVLFITGQSGSGKSMFTDNLTRQIISDAKKQYNEDWTVCSVAASNPFDEYNGEEVLIMDDLRGMSLTASDWLKLLDPDRAHYGGARYRNKRMACRVVIINSEKDVLEFFYYLKNSGGNKSEAMDQFFRRIMARVKVYRVPDSPDVRRIEVGEVQDSNKYLAEIPGTRNCYGDCDRVSLCYNFEKDVQDMDYDDAQQYLSTLVMKHNGLIANHNPRQ